MARSAAVYLRVSTEDQTVENQRLPILDWLERHEITEFVEYVDVASGAEESRTQLDKMMGGIRSKEHDLVIVYKLDRLGRSLQHLLLMIQEFRNKGIQFVSLSESIDTETAQGRLFLQLSGAFAEYERELIRERTNAGLARAKAQGKKLGRPKGSKDKKRRRKSGYYQRWAKNE